MLRPGCRCFSTARPQRSYVGSAPINLPAGVTLTDLPPPSRSSTRTLAVAGPRGELRLPLPAYVALRREATAAGESVSLSVGDAGAKAQRSMWGTTRALLANAVLGVTEGFTVSLKFVGVGYRAAVEADTVVLRVGFSKPVVLRVPDGVAARCPQPTSLVLEGRDRQVLTQFAAVCRSYRPPEPYKGKGIFVDDEKIKIKSPAGKK